MGTTTGRKGDRRGRAGRARRIVFVASSREAKPKAQKVVNVLKQEAFEPLPWWSPEAFRGGDITFPRLLELSQMVDAAIVLSTGDDVTWYRGDETKAPRDNVLLEFGVFSSRLGVKRTLILHEKQAKIPGDLDGLTHYAMSEGVERAAKLASRHLSDQFSVGPAPVSMAGRAMIVCDPSLVPVMGGRDFDRDWLMRAFYFGRGGAKAWLRISTDPKYQAEPRKSPVKNAIEELLRSSDSRFRTFVSLGPGDAKLDMCIAVALVDREKELEYVPVDLSDGLLLNACQAVASVARVPLGILADFEGRLPFVIDEVRSRTKGPHLFGLFGNTLGNLDGSDGAFMEKLRTYLKPGDQVMLDVAVRKQPDQGIEIAGLPEGTVAFFAYGAAVHLGVETQQLERDLARKAGFEELEFPGDIPGTLTFQFYAIDGAGAKLPCARIRRYDLAGLVKWLGEHGFEVRPQPIPEKGSYDNAALSLRRS